MPKFYYICRDKNGDKKSGVEEALNQDEAVNKLQASGLIVVSVIQENLEPVLKGPEDGAVKKKTRVKHTNITGDDLTLFCRQLSTLLGAGITILRSIDIISKQVTSKKLYIVLMDLNKNLEAGLSFHEALSRHPKVFSELWVNLVESGEASGNLAVILARLATNLERNAEFKKKIISALIYPAILFCAGLIALLFMTIKVIPTFAEIFKGFNIELPFLTKLLLGVSLFIRNYSLILVGAIVALFWFLKKFISTKQGKRKYEEIILEMPIFGEFFRTFIIERFTSEMSTLVESGVPILYSLEISERSVGSAVLGSIIRKIKDDVRDGKPLGQSLEKSNFFDPMAVSMINIGEEIGELSSMFKRLNTFYQEYLNTFLVRVTAMFEPIMLVVMGVSIGIMVIGMFLPIFEISQIGGK